MTQAFVAHLSFAWIKIINQLLIGALTQEEGNGGIRENYSSNLVEPLLRDRRGDIPIGSNYFIELILCCREALVYRDFSFQEFNMTAEGSLEWSLCECTVTEDGVIKQRRLPPQMENLAERIALNSRCVSSVVPLFLLSGNIAVIL